MKGCIPWLIAVFFLGCSAGPRTSRGALTRDLKTQDPDIRASCHLAEVKCSRCHNIARLKRVQPRNPRSWERYVRKMRLQPRSGISVAESKTIVQCLVFRSFGQPGLDNYISGN